jgi:GT2 family glycosyltransferase
LTIDVIIVTWHSGGRVLRCLEHLAEQRVHTTFLVDNASGDGTVDGVRERFPDVQVIELERNVGFGSAVNAGASAGHGEAIVLINDDVELEPGSLAALVEPLEADARTGMVAGVTVMPGSDIIDGFGIELDATLAAYNRGRHQPASSATLGRLAMPSGGLAAYRRSAIEQAGGFDERLFAYGEDVDLGLRLRRLGWAASAAAQARATHVGGATIGVDSPRQRELAGFARGFLLRRYGVLRTRACLRAAVVETLVIGWGLVRHRTLIPVSARIRGWRAASGDRLVPAPDAIDRSISMSEALRRLRQPR